MLTKRLWVIFLGILIMIQVGGCQQLNINSDDSISPSAIGMEKRAPFGEEVRVEVLQVIMRGERSINQGETEGDYRYWDPVLAKQLRLNNYDQHTLRSMGRLTPLTVQFVSIFDADPATIRVSGITEHEASVEMVLPRGDEEIGNRLQYVLEKQDEAGWRIVGKQLLNNWE
jgi:hypothetical protein